MNKNTKEEKKLQDNSAKPDQTTELEQKVGELTLGWQRCQADFTNYRRQVDEDRKKLIKIANLDLIESILPVLDNFQLAAKHAPKELENNNWAIGIKQIEKQLENILEDEGLTKIETVGQQFDPALHEAIEHVPSEKPEDEITEEISSGYQFDGQIVRPAKVKVSGGKQS